MHIAGTHLRGPDSKYNIGPAGELLPEGGEVIGFCSWREGLALRPELAGRVSGVRDVAEGGLRLVNRELGAEARSLLDRQLADAGIEGSQLPGYDTHADGHLQVAAAIPAGQVSTREVQGLLKVLSSAWLLDQLASLPGYDPGRCGERIAALPPRH